jgi:hypothetical protein
LSAATKLKEKALKKRSPLLAPPEEASDKAFFQLGFFRHQPAVPKL